MIVTIMAGLIFFGLLGVVKRLLIEYGYAHIDEEDDFVDGMNNQTFIAIGEIDMAMEDDPDADIYSVANNALKKWPGASEGAIFEHIRKERFRRFRR